MRCRLVAWQAAAVAAIILGSPSVAHAQSAIDGFNPGANGGVTAVALQPDGRIVVGGEFTMLGGGGGTGPTPRNRIGRLHSDGSLDAGFDPGVDGWVSRLIVQPDGKVLVAGAFTLIGGGGSGSVPRNNLARLNPDGSVDATFDPGANGLVRAMALQADGRIVVAGEFTMLGGGGAGTVPRNFIGRVNPDGSLDGTFDPGANTAVLALAVQANGQILVGGSFQTLGGGGSGTVTRHHIGRLNPDGSIDSTFNPGASATICAMAVLDNGQIVVGGFFNMLGGGGAGTTPRARIGRLNADGSLDAVFDPGANDVIWVLTVQADGRILVGGTFTALGNGGSTPRTGIGRLLPDGSLDATFDAGGNGLTRVIVVQPDDRILTERSVLTLARLNPDGSVETTFNPGANAAVYTTAVQADGRTLLGGEFTALGGGTGAAPRSFLGRIDLDGTVDLAFDPGANGPVYSLVVQADGKILVGGDFTTLGGGGSGSVTRNFIGRLHPDGSVDSTFNPGADAPVRTLALQADGKIVAGGFFTGLGGGTGTTVRYGVGRINADGSVDAAFDPGANGAVWTLAVEGDGQILVGGAFTMLGGGTGSTPRAFIGRVNPDGSVDVGFDPGADSYVYTIAVQADGRILCGGFFTTLGGGGTGTAVRRRIGRLNADGSLDATFNPGANSTVLTFALQADGRILVGGAFTKLGGGGSGAATRHRIGRLHSDGALDPSYDPGANDLVFTLTLQPDGKVIAGGAFTSLGGGFVGTSLRKGIGRLTNTGAATGAPVNWHADGAVTWSRGGTAPEVARTDFEYSTDGVTFTPIGSGSRVAGGWEVADVSLPLNQDVLIRGRGYYATGMLGGSGSTVESIATTYLACPTVLPVSLAAATLGVPYGVTFTAPGSVGVVTFVLSGTLPAGLTFASGVIAGTPTQTGSFPLTVTATDGLSGCAGSRSVTLVVAFASPDVTSFDPGANGDVWALATQADGKIVVGGSFTMIGGGGTGSTPRNFLARLNANGSLDTSFDPGTDGFVSGIALQPDGKIIVTGSFTMMGAGGIGNTPRGRIARLNPDGSLDTGFDPGANGEIYALVLQADGRILVGGGFTQIAGTSRGRIARLESNGTIESTFDPGANAAVYTLVQQPDGRILAGGEFSRLGGGGFGVTTRNFLGRLNADGSLDAGFNPGADFTVSVLAPQADGRILAGGEFSGLGGGTGTTARSFIGRLNADGSVDMGFDPGANDLVSSFAPQSDGRILVAGCFTQLGGGATGTMPRRGVGRLNPDGTADATFNPGSDSGCVLGMAPLADGRLIVGGGFTALGGGTGTTPRSRIGQLLNTEPAVESVTFAPGGSSVTWQRGGSSPEVLRTTFEASTDGSTFSPMGSGSRVVGGWTLGGLSLPADPNLRVRARGYHASGSWNGSGSIVETVSPAAGSNLLENGTFTSGTASWSQFATPDATYLVSSVVNGVLEFYRVAPPPETTNQAVVYQNTGLPLGAVVPIHAQFDLGNSSSVRKRISVLIHDADFSDLSVCTFWLAPNAPLQTYQMRTHTTETWTNATISFYAASTGSNGGSYRLDNVSMQHAPAGVIDRTDCVDPSAPAPPGGSAGPSLIGNGDFSGPTLAPWDVFGTITWRLAGERFEFYRPAGLPAGVVLQPSGMPAAQHQILTATLDLGNSSPVRKRVTVLLHDADFSDLAACTFWLAPQSPLLTFQVRTFATEAWANATVSVYPSTVGPEAWIGLDNVTFRQTPSAAVLGTECIEAAIAPAVVSADDASARASDVASDWAGTSGFGLVSGTESGASPRFRALGRGPGREVLAWRQPIDLTDASAATLSFVSALSDGATGDVQISSDGITWVTLREVPLEEGRLSIDLSPFAGRVIYLRFVFTSRGLMDAGPIQVWLIGEVAIDIRR